MGTPSEWMLTSIRVRDLARAWSNRTDLSASVVKNQRRGSLANYVPERAQITVDADVAFPGFEAREVGDITDRMELAKFPVAGGIILHESMHARMMVNRWTPEFVASVGNKAQWTVFELLEEMRVEYWGANLHPRDVGYLRASLRSAIMRDSDTWAGSARFAAQVILGRHYIGVLPWTDVEKVHAWLKGEGWSNFQLDEVKRITLEFAKLADNGVDLKKQILLARELDSIMPEDPKKYGKAGEGDEDGDFDEEIDGDGFPDGLLEAILDALTSSERGGINQVFEEAVEQASEQAQAEEQRQQKEHKENKSKADQVFRMPDGTPAAVPTNLASARNPTSSEKTAAVILAQELEQAKYRDQHIEEYASELPPGRFNGSEAMRRSAALWAGASPDPYKPFKKSKRMETDEPTLTVGIMCDTTGSMSDIQAGVGSAVWIISEAVYRTDEATAAQVYFGTDVRPGLRAGERLSEVRTWKGAGARHDFDGGFRALDGELNLLQGTGARLLFVISDGIYEMHQVDATEKWMDACEKAGVAVIWLKIEGGSFREGLDVTRVDVNPDKLTDTASAIGRACVESLATASGISSGGW